MLEASFKTLQRHLHPDKHATQGTEVRGYAEQHSAQLNAGYNTLKDPLQRAQYLVCDQPSWHLYLQPSHGLHVVMALHSISVRSSASKSILSSYAAAQVVGASYPRRRDFGRP